MLASYRINSSTNPMINLPSSAFRSFSDMNIVSVTVTTGAAGVSVISGQMAAFTKTKYRRAIIMGFSGGGGSTGTAAHTHNSTLVGDGGSLSTSLTQLDDSNLYTRIIIGA